MAKEQLQKLDELAEKRSALSGIVSQNERLKANVDAELGQGGFIVVPPRKKIQPQMSFAEVKDVARYNLRNTPEKVAEKKELLKNKIGDDSRVRLAELELIDRQLEEFAPIYVAVLNTLTDEVTELAELTVQGGLTEDEFQPFKEEFDQLASLPDQIPPLKRGIEKLKSRPEVSDKASVPPGILADEIEYPEFEKDQTDTGKKETEQSLPKLKVEKGKKVTITNAAGDKSLNMRQNSHQFALLDLLLLNPGLAINYFDFSDILVRRGSSADARTMILALGKKLKEVYPDIDLITEESMGYSGTYQHHGFKLNAEVELVEPRPDPIPTPTGVDKDRLDEHHKETSDDTESEKTKATIKLLSESRLKIGKRIIDAKLNTSDAGKKVGERRIKVLKALEKFQEEGKIPSRKVWEEAFPGEEYNRSKLTAIRKWLIENINYAGKQVIFYKDMRRGSYYNVPEHKIELIEPGKSRETSGSPLPGKDPAEKPQARKSEDTFTFPNGKEIKGNTATLTRTLVEGLSHPGLFMTIEDMAIAVFGNAEEKSKKDIHSILTYVRKKIRENMGIEISSTYIRGTIPTEEIRYFRKNISPAELEKPVENASEAAALVEDERLKIIPTIEEATLLVGYFTFHENIFEEIGINPPPDYLRDKLEHALGDKNGRTEVDILELRQNGFQKIKKLIKEDILSVVLDELDANDPRFDFLRYFKDFESLQIEYERIGSTMPHHISVIDFLDMWLNSQIDLTKVTNIRNYIRAEEIDDKETAKDDIQTGAEILFEAAPPAHDAVTEAGGITSPEIEEETEKFARTEEITVFPQDEEGPAAELKEIEKQFTGIREKISGVVDLVLGHSELNQGLKRREISSYFIGISQKDIDRAINRHYIDVDTIFNRKNRPGQSDHLNPAAVATLAILKELPQELPRNMKIEIKELVAEEFEKRRENNTAALTPVSTDETEEILAQTADMTETDLAVDIESILNDLYDQVQGLNPAGVSFRAVRGRFPNLKAKHLRNAFERNILPENLPGGPGGVQLDHDSIVTLQFYYTNERNFDSPYFKKTFEQIKKKVKRERENRPTEPKDRFIEG
jgi:hypothetical protein